MNFHSIFQLFLESRIDQEIRNKKIIGRGAANSSQDNEEKKSEEGKIYEFVKSVVKVRALDARCAMHQAGASSGLLRKLVCAAARQFCPTPLQP